MRERYDIAFLGGRARRLPGRDPGRPARSQGRGGGGEGLLEVAQALHGQAIHVPPEAQGP